MSGVEVTIRLTADDVAWIQDNEFSGDSIWNRVKAALPRPIEAGDRVRTRLGYVGSVLAVDGGEAWVRFDDGRGTWPLSMLTRVGGS